MINDQEPVPILRRLGDIIQGLAVIAISGLVVVVVDLRITMVQNQDMIIAQDKLYSQNFKALRENIGLQIKILESIVKRVTNNGFSANQGVALQEHIRILYAKIDKNEVEIKKIYEKMYDQFRENSSDKK